MALGDKREPKTRALSANSKLNDNDINDFTSCLQKILVKDFPIQDKFENIKSILSADEIEKLKLCKLLYCTGYKKELFLHIGVILESRVNSIIDLYKAKSWRTTLSYNSEAARNHNFDVFVNSKTLNEKAASIVGWNLFNNSDASERIKNKMQSFRILRNYGGHGKALNQYIESIIVEDGDTEIVEAFNLLAEIERAKTHLIANPPPLI